MIASGKKAKQGYKQFAKARTPQRPVGRNVIRAFLVGGTICLIGQLVQTFYMTVFDFSKKEAANPTVATLIFLSVLLTGLGVYDRIGQWAGAGSAVPVTGFANSMASAALEYKSEGYVLGVAGNMFRLAGPVIVYGTVAAFFVALVRYLVERL
ncbi:stage V sporulation protein AC [Effusibacillus lacus]|uniref:Stage V sporulation protein AC n=1 Tax=Effusibacillus lacus TaxID=1348429 RepID=A0A292YTP6_9BACL|nr:stage V sporulation protein AC [Effusibacillus lacus]TCS76309.1 stage V sporulation protein AC [Effusibacillus lacus]GAX91855.1 stage V sporulation protein AC [Effusibacillus lacus]